MFVAARSTAPESVSGLIGDGTVCRMPNRWVVVWFLLTDTACMAATMARSCCCVNWRGRDALLYYCVILLGALSHYVYYCAAELPIVHCGWHRGAHCRWHRGAWHRGTVGGTVGDWEAALPLQHGVGACRSSYVVFFVSYGYLCVTMCMHVCHSVCARPCVMQRGRIFFVRAS